MMIVMVFLLSTLFIAMAWYVVSSIIAYKYVKACNENEAWVVLLPYVRWLVVIASCISMIALFVLNCIYIYNVASDLDEPDVLCVILFILFCGLAEPFILHSLRKEIEVEWK